MRRLVPALVLCLAAACDGLGRPPGALADVTVDETAGKLVSEPTRVASRAGRFGAVVPAGWRLRLGQTDLTLTAGEPGHPRRGAVFLRTAPIEGDWSAKRTPELVIPATRKVIEGLPQARLGTTESLQPPGFSGAAFEVSFSTVDGRRYDRRHVVLLGHRQVFHVVHTALSGHLGDTRADFDSVLATLREE
jgi:hypothetical protein